MRIQTICNQRVQRASEPRRPHRVRRTSAFAGLALALAFILYVVSGTPTAFATPLPQEETVEVSLVEWDIEMPESLPAGPTTFEVTNNGEFDHNIEIEGQGIEEEFESDLAPGETRTMQIDLQPGEYEVYCPIGNHAQRGMQLTLTVTEADAVEMTDSAEMTGTQEMTDTSGMTDTSEVTDTEGITEETIITNTGAMAETDSLTATVSTTESASLTPVVVIRLDEAVITEQEFNQLYQRLIRTISEQRGIPINDQTLILFDNLRNQFLEELAVQQVLLAEAEAQGIEISEAEIENSLMQVRQNFANEEDFQDTLQASGFADEEEFRTFIRENILIERVLDQLGEGTDISESEVSDYYEESPQLFEDEEGTVVPLEEVADEIRNLLAQQQLQEQIMNMRDESGVEIFPENLSPIQESLVRADASTSFGDEDATGEDATGEEMTGEEAANRISVSNQEITDGTVTIDEVATEEPAWLVIYANEGGDPGATVGHTAVEPGTQTDVTVEISTTEATGTLIAKLHMDAGTEGEFEYPGPDAPILAADGVGEITEIFTVTDMTLNNGESPADEPVGEETDEADEASEATDESATAQEPSVTVQNQDTVGGVLVIDEVVSDGAGWIVIHADDNGAPGAVLGSQIVIDGVNNGVVVVIDPAEATETLYAMLHTDAGELGVFEFPGPDEPVIVDGFPVSPPFQVTDFETR